MEICRLCLNEEAAAHSIFDLNFQKLIDECVSIKVTVQDTFPKHICPICLDQLKRWLQFRDDCQRSNEILLKRREDESNGWKVDDGKIGYGSEESSEDDAEKEDEILEDVFFDHSIKFDANTYTCEICSKEFTDCLEYLDHQETHDGQPNFKCNRCTEIFTTRKELVEHDNGHKIPCHQCGKLILKKSMKLHLIRHTDKYKCKECPGRFNSQAGLKQHVITVHTDIKDHICEQCGKRFSSQTSIRVHMKSHSDERSYQCKQCEYAGRTASALYIHMSTHANDFRVCERCSKTFKSTRNLNDHIRRVHCKNKKHECSYCSKRFVDKYILRVHMRCHTGVRPYKCDKCDKSFIRSDGLKEHMVTHEQRVLYDCMECGKRFTSKRGVTRHVCTGINVL